MSLRRINKSDERSACRALLFIYGYAYAIDEVTQAPLPALSRAERRRLVPLGTSVRRNFGLAFRAVCRPAGVRAPVRRTTRRRANVRRRPLRSTADPPPPPLLACSSLGRLTNGPGTPRPAHADRGYCGRAARSVAEGRRQAPACANSRGRRRPAGGSGGEPRGGEAAEGRGGPKAPLVRGGPGAPEAPLCGPRSGRPRKREEISVPRRDYSGFRSSAVATPPPARPAEAPHG